MKMLIKAIKWDLKFLTRYNILTVAIIIAVFYTGIFLLFDLKGKTDILIALIFSDPTFMGFIFVGVLVLFEKSSNTLQALVVTPLKIGQYLFSKAIALTLIALVICFTMVFAGFGFRFNYFMFLLATLLSSLLFVFLGLIGVSKVKTFNQYIIIIPLFLAPLSLPYLNFFGITDTYWLYLIPTQASFILFEAAFKPVPFIELAYGIVYLVASMFVAFFISRRLFTKYLIRGE